MLLRPKKTKYQKSQRCRLPGVQSSFSPVIFGTLGLVSQEAGFISAKQIESTRQVINRHLKRKARIWIRAYPDYPKTSKPTEVRMGKGKGNIEGWYCRVGQGKVLFEVSAPNLIKIEEALNLAKKKLSLKTYVYRSSKLKAG